MVMKGSNTDLINSIIHYMFPYSFFFTLSTVMAKDVKLQGACPAQPSNHGCNQQRLICHQPSCVCDLWFDTYLA